MTIRQPHSDEVPKLRRLWQLVFGDTDLFLDNFFACAYSPRRCLCATQGDALAGMLYWLPCGSFAYIYAVATHPDHRGKGICRALMDAAHAEILRQGYDGALLYPQEEGLREMYRKMGYFQETRIRELRCSAGNEAARLERIGPEEYFSARCSLLPPDAVDQGAPFPQMTKDLLFFRGEGFLLAANGSDAFFAQELLGDLTKAPGILKALEKEQGTFRCPGDGLPFAMFRPLRDAAAAPGYFAFPLD